MFIPEQKETWKEKESLYLFNFSQDDMDVRNRKGKKKNMGIEERRCHLSLSSLSCCRNIGNWSVSKDNRGPDFIIKGEKILYNVVSKSSHVLRFERHTDLEQWHCWTQNCWVDW